MLAQYKINKLDVLNYILVIILVYLMCTRKYNKYDEVITYVLGIICFSNIFITKKYLKINKTIVFFLITWCILITNSLTKMIFNYSEGEYIKFYRYIMIDGVLLFFIFTQLNINRLLMKDRLLIMINLLSVYPLSKGIDFILENGIFKRGFIWGNPNHYSMIMGFFIIISFVSFVTENRVRYKIFFLILNILQFFTMNCVGQSRNVFFALNLIYGLVIGLHYNFFKKNNIKKLFILLLGICVIFFCFEFFNLGEKYRIFRIGFEDLITNPRILLWKKGLIDDEFNFILGKGFAYYTMNTFKDTVGVTISTLHNDCIEILVTQGIISLITYLGFIFYSLKVILREYLVTNNKIFLITVVFIVYFLMIGMLENPIYNKRAVQFLFMFIGLSLHLINDRINKI